MGKGKKIIFALLAILFAFTTTTFAQKSKGVLKGAYLEITLKINDADREAAAGVYLKYKTPFLKNINGAVSKELLIRTDDVQVLHGFKTVEDAEAYLKSDLFQKDVVESLKPYLQASPDVRVYSVFNK
ncbi:hypothetical protein [Myroides odoratimimus]|uniref:hypothetical protein n=1 Tax=Myroides odoratimimus TaxID=76832 RepID=UPI003100CE7D